MKKSNKRILSLLTAVCMLLGMIVVPGGVTVANAANVTDVSIPSAEKVYLNNTFENGGEGITFTATKTGEVAEIRADSGYLYLEKNGEGAPSITRTLTEDEITPYLVVEAALASTELSGASLKLTGTTETLSFVDVAADGKITSFDADTGVTVAADGTYVTVTVSVDAVANTYSLWFDGVQAVKNAAISVEGFGSVTAMSIELNGENTEAANLMVDNLKVYRYAAVYYDNDFSEDAGVTFTPGTGVAELKDGTLYLAKAEAAQAPKLNVALPDVAYTDQVVVSMDISSTNFFRVYVKLVGEKATSGSTARFEGTANTTNGYLMASSSNARGGTLTAGTVYNIAVVVNYSRNIFNLYLNGTKCVANGNEAGEWSLGDIGDLTGISFETVSYSVTGCDDGDLTIDKIQVYEGAEPKTIDATQIPEPVETYIDNSFEADDLSDLVLTPNGSANKAEAYEPNHYVYVSHNAGGYPNATIDLSAVDSHYIVVSLDVATPGGGSPLYVSASDGTNTTTNLIRINEDGEIMTSNSSLSTKCYIPTDGQFTHFDVVIDTNANVYSFWYNGKAWGAWGGAAGTVRSLNGTTDFGMLTSLKFSSGWTSGSNNMIDNLKVYSYDPEAAAPTYTVTWKNYDGTVLETDENVKAGTVPTYDGETPTKETRIHNVYTFSGWDTTPAAVTGDVTYTAQYTEEKTPCVDADPKDHQCDICTEILSTHSWNAETGKCNICGDECVHANGGTDHECDICGKTLGECNDGDPKDHKCNVCGADMGTHAPADGKHTCDYCGQPADDGCADTDPADHKCDVCEETLSQCSGGTATCTAQAVCTTCGQPYGELAAHVYVDGYCTCGAKDPNAVFVAEVGNKEYTTLAAAIAAADAGSTVTLMNDVSLNETVTISTGIILDLNGKTITSEAVDSVAVRVNGADIAVTITGNGTITSNGTAVHVKNGTVTIENGTYTSTYTAGAFKNAALYVGNEEDGNNGVAIINGGTFNGSTGHAYALRVCDGIITVNDGSFDGANNACCTGVMNIKGGSFTSDDVWSETEKDILYVENPSCNCGVGVINVTGGTFYGQNPAEASISSSATTSYVAEGYIAVEASGVYTVQEGKWMADVDGERYHDLQEAVDAAVESGATLVLTEDADTITVAENKTLVLNFNGKTVGEIVVNGTLYGIDETTKNYTAEPLKVKISGDGEVAPVHQVDTDGKDHTYAGYAAQVSEGYATFNYFEVKIASVTLRPSEAGIGYKLYLAGNANVKAMLNESNAFGVTVYPEGTKGKSAYAGSASFAVGAQTKMVMIKNILSGNDAEQNAANGNVKLCVSAYVNINGEKVEIAYADGKSLVEVFNSINDNLGSYNDVQKAALKTLYNTYIKANEAVFTAEGWKFDKIKEITDPEQN